MDDQRVLLFNLKMFASECMKELEDPMPFEPSELGRRATLSDVESHIQEYLSRVLEPLIESPIFVQDPPTDITTEQAQGRKNQLRGFSSRLRAASLVAHYRGTYTADGKKTGWLISDNYFSQNYLKSTEETKSYIRLYLELFRHSHSFNEIILQTLQQHYFRNPPTKIITIIGSPDKDFPSSFEKTDTEIQIRISHTLWRMLTVDERLCNQLHEAAKELLASQEQDEKKAVTNIIRGLENRCFIETRETSVTLAKNYLLTEDESTRKFATDLTQYFNGGLFETDLHHSLSLRRALIGLQACCMFREICGAHMWFFPVYRLKEQGKGDSKQDAAASTWCSLSVYPEMHLENEEYNNLTNEWQEISRIVIEELLTPTLDIAGLSQEEGRDDLEGVIGKKEIADPITDRISLRKGLLTPGVLASALSVMEKLRGFNHEGEIVELALILGSEFHATEFMQTVLPFGEPKNLPSALASEEEREKISEAVATIKGSFAFFKGHRRAIFAQYSTMGGVDIDRIVEVRGVGAMPNEQLLRPEGRIGIYEDLTRQSDDIVAIITTKGPVPGLKVYHSGECVLESDYQGWHLPDQEKFAEEWQKVIRQIEAQKPDYDVNDKKLALLERVVKRVAKDEHVGATFVIGHNVSEYVTRFSSKMTELLPSIEQQYLLEPKENDAIFKLSLPEREDALFRLSIMDGATIADLTTGSVYGRRQLHACKNGIPIDPKLKLPEDEERLWDKMDSQTRTAWRKWGTRHQTAYLLSHREPELTIFVKSSSGELSVFAAGRYLYESLLQIDTLAEP
jgi:hypothetical protein